MQSLLTFLALIIAAASPTHAQDQPPPDPEALYTAATQMAPKDRIRKVEGLVQPMLLKLGHKEGKLEECRYLWGNLKDCENALAVASAVQFLPIARRASAQQSDGRERVRSIIKATKIFYALTSGGLEQTELMALSWVVANLEENPTLRGFKETLNFVIDKIKESSIPFTEFSDPPPFWITDYKPRARKQIEEVRDRAQAMELPLPENFFSYLLTYLDLLPDRIDAHASFTDPNLYLVIALSTESAFETAMRYYSLQWARSRTIMPANYLPDEKLLLNYGACGFAFFEKQDSSGVNSEIRRTAVWESNNPAAIGMVTVVHEAEHLVNERDVMSHQKKQSDGEELRKEALRTLLGGIHIEALSADLEELKKQHERLLAEKRSRTRGSFFDYKPSRGSFFDYKPSGCKWCTKYEQYCKHCGKDVYRKKEDRFGYFKNEETDKYNSNSNNNCTECNKYKWKDYCKFCDKGFRKREKRDFFSDEPKRTPFEEQDRRSSYLFGGYSSSLYRTKTANDYRYYSLRELQDELRELERRIARKENELSEAGKKFAEGLAEAIALESEMHADRTATILHTETRAFRRHLDFIAEMDRLYPGFRAALKLYIPHEIGILSDEKTDEELEQYIREGYLDGR